MTTRLTRVVLGLSLVAGSLVMARQASATVWKNFADESYCLSTLNGNTGTGTQVVVRPCDNGADQNWGKVFAPWNTGDYELFNMKAAAPPPFAPSNARCLGASGANVSNGINVIMWTCNNFSQSHDQGWRIVDSGFKSQDGLHSCYWFRNEQAWEAYPPHIVLQTFGVAGGIPSNNKAVIMWGKFSTGHHDQMWCEF